MRWFRRSQRDFEDEVRSHLELEADQLVAEGLPRDAAELMARRRFGNVGKAQERFHDAGRFSWLDDARTDVRFALRLAKHHPAFSLNVILISAIGIAACVATFSLVNGILLTPLSFPDQDRVFSLELNSAEGPTAAIPASTFRTIAASSVFDGVAASEPDHVIVEVNGQRVPIESARVTSSFFRVYRVRPALGRLFDEQRGPGDAASVVLGNPEWRSRFGGDSSVVGRTISIDGAPHVVIGVLPEGFFGNSEGFVAPPSMWLPLEVKTSDVNLTMRLADGVSVNRAAAYLSTVARSRVPSYQRNDSLPASPELVPVEEMIYGNVRRPLYILLASVGLVLALVAANVATLFLARAVTRQAELGVRGALGASWGRQFRQLVAESMTLTALGGAIGLGGAAVIIRVVRGLGSNVLPRMNHVTLDWRVAMFAMAAVVITGTAGGAAHFLSSKRASRPDTSGRLTGARTSTALVVAQVALSLVLLVGAGLLVKGFIRVAPSSPGFITANRAILSMFLDDDPGIKGDAAGRQMLAEITSRMRAVPGVDDVANAAYIPLSGMVSIQEVMFPGEAASARRRTAFSNVVSANYFRVMGIPLMLGRAFDAGDVDGSTPVAIISDTTAARWWPGANPIGREIIVGKGKRSRTLTVIGVVGGSRMSGRNRRMVPELYETTAQGDPGWMSFIAVTRVRPEAVLPALRGAVFAADPRLPILTTDTYSSIAGDAVRIPRFYSAAMSVFAAAAVLLSGLGIYGLLSFSVAQRRREIGVRMALGADARRIGWSVMSRALVIGCAGVALGLGAGLGLTRFLGSLLVEVAPTDFSVFLAVGVVGLLLAIAAAGAPAYHAARVDPMRSLRA